MTNTDFERLSAEQAEIAKRIEAAKGEEKEMLQRQYGERISQIAARLEEAAERGLLPKKAAAKADLPQVAVAA